MQVKKQIKVLQTEAKDVANKLNKEVVVVTKGVQHIQAQVGIVYQLTSKAFDIQKLNLVAKKVDNDLEVSLEDSVIIFDNYFDVCATDLSCLVSLPTEDGGFYYVVADTFFTLEDGTQIVYFYGEQSIISTESSAVDESDDQSFYDIVTSNMGGIIAFLTAFAIIGSNNDNNGNNGNNGNNNNDGNDDISATITGTASTGKYISGSTNDSVKVYKADGTGTTSAIGSSSLNEKGQYTITLTGDNANYTGAVYIKLIKSGIQHADELRGSEALDSDLFAVAYIHSGENIVNISARSSIVAKILSVDKTTAAIVLSETDINTWNEKVNTSFNLLGSAINTDVDTVNSLGDESNTQALQAGQVAAALSGMRDTVVTNTFEKVIEKMAGVIANNGALDQTALETLAIGAVAVKAKAEADKTATAAAIDENQSGSVAEALNIAKDAVTNAADAVTDAQKQAVIAAQKAYDEAVIADQKARNFVEMATDAVTRFNGLQIIVSSITITSDTGVADFITNDSTLVIGATLDGALSGGKKLWGSVDGGKTWTDVSVVGAGIVWSNANKTVAWTQNFTEDVSSSIQFVVTNTITATTATTAEIMNDKEGGVAHHDYIYDGTAPTEATIAIKSGEGNLVGVNKTAYLEVTYSNMAVGDAIQLQKGDSNKADLGSVYTVTSLDVNNNKATIAIKQTDLSDLSADSIFVSVKTITDLAGNINNTASDSQIFKVDVVAPTITAFSAVSGVYKEGAEIDLVATVSESVEVGAKITVTLNTGATVELVAATKGVTLTGTYTVEASQSNGSLSVSSFAIDASMPPTDIAGNVMTATTIASNIATDVIIDTIAPIFTSVATGMGIVGQDIAVYDANVSNGDADVEYTIDKTDKFNIDKNTGVVTYKTTPTVVTSEADNIVITATDVAGNAKTHNVAITVVDQPVVFITSDKPDGANGVFTLTFTFTEVVSGFEVGDINFGSANTNLTKGTLTPVSATSATNKVFTLTVTPKDALTDGDITVNIAAGVVTSQASGQPNIATSEFIQKFDETLPQVSITSGVLTSDTTPEISGTAEADATIKVVVAGATYTTKATDGTWSIDTSVAPDSGTLAFDENGGNLVSVTAMDVAGNIATVDQTLVIDTVATAKPVIGFTTGEDMYVNATETGVNLEISATGMAVGDTIQLKKNGANFGTTHTVSTTEITNGKAVINVAKSDLSSNSNTTTITATITDIVGNTSVISNAQNIVLDTTNPTLTNVVLVGDVNKTVVEATDNVLSFTAEIDSTVKVVFTGTNGAITKNITSASGTTEFIALIASDLTTLGEGVVSVKTTATDVAGNTIISNAGNFILDTQAPTAPISLNLADEDNTGSNSDNITKETSGLTISGTAEANATVELFNGTTSLGTVTANSGGNFTLDIDLSAGSLHEITAQATDAAGNVSDVSAVLAITVDTAAPTITVKTMGTIAPNSNLVATFSEAIAKGTGDIVIKESGGTITFATLGIQSTNITIGGTDNKTLTINPGTNLESGKSYYIEIASGVLTDVAGNNFAGINDSGTWAFSAASLSTTVAWSGANVDVTDGYINTSELSTTTVTGKVANPNGITGLSISEIKFFSTDSVVHTVSSALINAISIDNAGNWTLANNSNWTSGLNSNAKYTIQVKLSGTLLGNTVNGSGDTSEVTIDTTIADAPVGMHTVAISNDAGILDNDRITNDSAVKVSLTLGNNLVLASDEMLQVSADGATWVNATGINKAWATADDAVTLITGTGKTLTARVIDTAGNVTTLPLSDNSYTLDTGNPLVTLSTITDTKNTGNVSVQSSEIGTAYLVHSSVVVNVSTTQAMLDTLALANKVNKVTIATANTATDLVATDLEDGVYRVYTVDIAGNVSTASTATVTIDTSSPTAPISLDLADEDDSGSSNSDNLTKETSGLTISGTAEANATVELFNGTTSLGTVTVNNSGNFTLDIDLSAGSLHNVTAQATDAAGNVSDVSAVLAITVDTAAPTITVKTMGTIAPNSNLVATFSEAIAKGTGNIVIKESGGTITFATLDIQSANITIGGTDNKTLTINPGTNLESGKSYYIEIASGVLTDVAGNNFAGINDSGTWAFSAASLSTTVAWSGANVDVTDGYINTSELSTTTVTGKVANPNGITGLSISEIKFFSTDSVVHTVSSALINAISIDNAGNWTLANNSNWTSGLNSNAKYTIQVKLSGTLLGNTVNGSGDTSEVTIDTTITGAPVGTHTVAISNDAGVLDNDRITNDSAVKVSLTLGNNLVLASDETLQVSANGADWVATTGSNKTWATIDDAVTLITGTGKTLTARVIDTAGNVTALPLSDNSYTLDTGNPLVTLSTTTDTKNTGNVSVQSSETGTAYLVHSSVVVNVGTTQAMLDTLALANKVNKVTIATANTATDLAATDLEDGVYRVYTVDIAGNVSTASTATVTIDTSSPTAPISLDLADEDDSGSSNSDNLTKETSGLTISGTAEANATVELFNGTTSLGTVTANSGGNFTLDIDLLAGSLHEITAQATDAAGNVSDVSAVLAITVDTAAPTITVKTVDAIAPNSNLVATFSEAIAKGTGDIVIKESDGTTFATLGIQNSNITIGGTDNKTLTINPNTNLESGKSYYIEMASGVLTDVAGNNFAGIDDSSAWTFSAASLSTTVAWSGANVDVTDGYINTSELSTATVTGKVANPNGITGLSISEIKFFSTDSVVHTVSSALINAISIDNAGNWTLANNSNWTSGLNSNAKYTIQVKLSGTLLGNTVNGAGDTSEVTIDTTIVDAPVGTHTVAISNDAGVLDNDRITNDSAVKVSLTLGNNLVLASDETLQVSADGATWVNATGINKAWATADDAVTLIAGTGKTLTARVIDTAGNVTALPLSDNSYTLDTGNPLVTLSTTTDTKNTGNVSVQSSETGTAYLVHSSVVVNVGTTQAMLDTLALANKVNKVTIATANIATDLAATDLEDGVYRVYTVDIAGNVSTASTATVTIDTSSPTAPISLDLANEDDSGSSNSDNLTKETSGLTISGTAEANATVELFNGTTSLGTVTANSSGNFTLDIDLSAGSLHNVTAQATDAAGNVSDVSAVLAITVDTATPTITLETLGHMAPSSNLVATFNETITRGTGDIVIKESGGTIIFETLDIQSANITIGGTDNRTLTINPSTNLESGKSYYIEIASGVLTDVAGNNFAGINDSGTWAFSAASLSTTVAWSGANVSVTDGYINTSELSTATVTGRVANPNGITGLSISEIKFFSTDSVVHTVSSALINAISIDNAGNWTLANNSNWTSGLNSNAKYTIQVKLSGTLLGNTVNGSGDTSEVTIDTTITGAPVGTHTVAISNDAGVLDNDRITNDSAVKVSLTLGNNLVLASDETLQVSANGADWVATTGSNKTWATIDDAVTLITGTGKTLTARVIDTAGNVTALPLSDNSYTLDTGNPLVTLNTITDTKNTGNVSVQSSETGTAYLVHSSVVVNVSTTQAMLDTLASANKVNKVTIATANTATDLAATDLEDGVYRVYTVDIAGNVSTASTATVTIDTSSPTAPISLDLADEDDSGSSNSDNLTKETSGLTISGTAEANAIVELFNGTTSLGTVTANSGGNFTLDIDLLAGSLHEITAQATDAAGNVSDVSAVLAITVDTAAPTITVKTVGTIAPNSNLVATFSEAIAKGTGDIVIKESGGTITFATLGIQSTNITIGGTDNKTLTINPGTNLESGKSYYIEIASGVLTDVAGNNFAGINDSGTWAFSAASLSTTVAWSGANVDVTDGYINTSELSTTTVTGKVANPNGITGLSISEIKFFSTDSVVHTVSSALINAISIDNAGNWTLANNSNWTSGLNSNAKYTIQVKLSGTLLGNTVNGSGDTSEVTIDTTIADAPVGMHTVAISNDAGILDNDRITNDSAVKVSLTLGNNLVLASDEMLQVSADGATWVNATGINKAWATADDAVTLIAGTGKTLTARVIDTAGNVTALPLSDNSYTLDTGNPLVTLSTTTDTKNTGNVSVQSSETGTAYLVHSSVVVNVGTTQAMLDTLALANKVNKVTIATANIATDLAATDLEDGVYRVYTVDIAGNVSTASTATVTIDTSSPTAPISLDLANEDDSGSSNSDNLTKETSGLTISGTAEANATVELFNGTTSLGTVTANSSGNFTLDIDLSAGSLHNVTAQATDAAGNVSDVSAVLAITVDTATPTITLETLGHMAPSSNLVATFNETITRGTGDIVIKESGGTIIFETLDIQSANITIGGTDNRTLTINPSTNLESGKSYYIEIASGVLTDVAGNNFAGINDSGTWAFSAASLSTTVAWSGANVSVTDGYINTSELSTATVTGRVANPNGITGLSISEIKFFSTDSVVHTVSSALINAISIDNAGNWTLANNSNWTSGLNSNAKYTIQVKLSGTLLGNTVNGSGDTSEVTIDTTITGAPVGTHTVAISNDAGVLDNDRITNDSAVKVSLTLGNNLVLASDETLQVSANGADWVATTGSNKTWATIDDAVTLITGTGKTLTARVIDTAGNVTALPLSDNSYTLDTGNPLVTLNTITDTKNTGNVSVQSSETGTAYLVHSSVVVNVSTTQAMLDTLASANKVNKVTIATANTATDLAATDLEDGVYRVYTVDIAGNVSTASTATVTIDTSSPTAPISLDLADEDDSGSSNSDNLTKETSGLTISGTAEANATVELFNGTTSLGTVTANSGGNFTLDIDLLAGSLHEITAQATDAAGNVSDVSAVLAITVDTAAPTITVKTVDAIAPNSNLVATFSEAIAKGTGGIVIKESDGTIFETLDIQHANITIGGTDNKTLTINPSANLESGKSYYIEMASGVLTDVAGNNFAGIDNSSAWTFSAASLSTTVAWSGANVDVTDGYINTSELSTATVTGKVANPNGITGLSISEIKFFSTDSVVHTVSSALINAISIDNAGNWTLANNSNWTSGLNSNAKYTIQVKLSGTLLGNTVNGSGDASEVTIDTTITGAPVGMHTVAISNDAGILDNDRITNDSAVKVSLTLGNNLVLASDEMLQVSADGATWVNATGINKAWATADDAVTLIAGTGKTLTARVIDTAGNVTALPLSDNSYTLDTGNPLVTLSTTTDTKNTGNVSVQSSETGTAYLVHSSVVVNVGTTQAMLDTLALANKVNKVTIATANTATDLAATDLEDGVYRVYTVDVAGNVSTASTATVTIDTSSPTAPISLDLANEDDSGSSNSDNLTKETSGLTISGTAEANATVELFNGTTSLGTVTVNSGGNFTLDIDLSAGSLHNVTAQATDAAGNVSDVSAVLAITVDTAAPTITVKTVDAIAPNSNLVATFSEAIAKGTGNIVIKESGGTITFATLGIQSTNITIGGTDNKTLTINPGTNLESGKSYYIEIASGVLTDVAGNNFAGIDNSSAWTFSAASLSTTVAWSGANVDVTDGYINTSELSTATVTGKVANPNGITGLSISEIKFFSTDSVVHTVSSALINAISIDNAGNWTLANNSNWTSGLNSNAKYTIQVKLSGTLLGNTVNGSGDASEVTIDTTIADAPVGMHTVAISNDAGILDNDRITNDSAVKVSLTLGNNLVLASDETLQVSANGTDWVATTGSNKTWATIDDAVTLITGTGKTLTARVIDTAGNVTALPLSDNSYTLDTGNPLVTLSTTTDTKNTGNVSVQSSETGTAYLVHSSVVVNVGTTQAMLDTLALANKVNKVTIATANTATDLAATDLEDGVYRVYTVDIAGNVSTASTATVTIDTSSPTAPISLDLADEDDSGSSNSDNLTKETSGLTISGTAEANATVELFNGTTSLGTVTANSGGNFTLDIDLLAGSLHEITAQATDVAGNVSDVSAVLAITVDTAAPTITVKTVDAIAPNSNLVATFSEAIAKGTGGIVIKESDGTIFETLDIQHANITIGGTDNKTLTINPSANLESGKSYYIEMASGVLTDVAGNNFAGIDNSSAWTFSAASLSTTVAWSGANVDVTDGYINTSELSTATVTGKVANPNGITGLSISEIKFFSTDSVVHTVSSALINAIIIDNAGNWTLANNSNWTSGLNSNAKYTIQVKLSGTLLGNTVNGAGDTSEVTIDTTITGAPVGMHTVAISNDAGVLDNDRITNDSAVKVSLTLGNNLVLASDETLQVSADGATWVNATGINKAWATADDAVTLIAGTGKTLTARVIDTAGNVTALPLSDNSYTLDIVKPTVTAVAVTASSNLLTIGDTVIVTLTTDEIINVIKGDDANTPQYEIMIGDVARQAIYKSGSGSTSLVFEYTIISGDTDTVGGIAAGVNKLTANGTSTLKDIAGNDLDLNAVTATSVNTLVVDTIAPTIAITMSDTTLSTGETTAVTFTFSEALAVGKNIDNVLESVANATVRNHWSDNGRASDVIITGLDSFTLTSNGAVFGTDNIIHSTAIANTWIIGATDSGLGRYLVVSLYDKPNSDGIDYLAYSIYSHSSAGSAHTDRINSIESTSDFITSGWIDGNPHYSFSGLKSKILTNIFDISDITSPNGVLTDLTANSSNTVYTATFTPTAGIEDATNVITVNTNWTDVAGNAPTVGTSSDNYQIDSKKPNAPIDLNLADEDDSGSSNSDNLTKETSGLTISGTAEANATVELFNGTTSLGTVTANSGGNFTLDIDLSAGSLHNVTAQATDAAGNVSDVSAVLAITVDTAAPTITVKTVGTIAPNSNLVATFSEAIAKGTGGIVIKESDGTIFETLGIQHANITIGGTDNKTLTINPNTNLESGKSYYIEMASGVLTDVAGNNFAGIDDSSAWTFSAASLSTTVAWSGANVDVTDGYINTSELSTATVTGKVANPNGITGLSISEIKFFSTDSVVHTVSSALINAIIIDNAGNWTLANDNDWTSKLNNNAKYTIQVKLSGTLLGNTVNGSGEAPEVTIDINAPTPTSWSVTSPTEQFSFKTGDTITVTLTMNEALKLGTTTDTKIVIDGKDFNLDATEGAGKASPSTEEAKQLVFKYIVAVGDNINTADFDIDYDSNNNNTANINLTGVTNTRGNAPDLSSITSTVELKPFSFQQFSVSVIGLYVHDETITISTSNLNNGDKSWAVFHDGDYAKAVQFSITRMGDDYLFQVYQAKYIEWADYSGNPNYFDNAGNSRYLVTTETDSGYGLKNITINGVTTSGAVTTTGKTIVAIDVLFVDAIAPTIAITMSDTTLSTGETTAVTFTFSEALAVGKNIDNVLESVANATVRNHWSDNGRASDVVITGLDSFTLTSNGAVFGTDNIIHSTAIANTWIIGATDSALGRYLVVSLYDKPNSDGIDYLAYSIYSKASAGSAHTDRINSIESTSDFITSGWIDGNPHYSFSGLKSKILTNIFDISDITSSNGVLTDLTANSSNTVYTATFTPTVDIKDATNVITVNTNWTNVAGNAPTEITESSNYKVNTVTPMAIMDQITVLNSGSVKVRSNKDGVAYLVISSLSSSAPTQAKLDAYVNHPTAGIAVKTDILADTFTDLSISGLGAGRRYYLCTVDTVGNVSVRSINNITVIAGNTLSGNADANNLIGGTGADTITGGVGADILTGGAGADIFKYNAIADSTQTNADTITDFDVTADKLDLIDIITTATNGAITDVASLAKYIHAEIDTSVATNVKLYIKTDGVSTGIVNSSNANMLINFTVADAAAQSALVAALNDNTFGEYILVDNTSPIATMEETAALISADIEIKSNETGTAYLFKDTLDLTSQSLDIFDNYVSDITANTAIKTEISANTLTNLSTSGLEAGQYHLYIIDTTGNISTESTNALTLKEGNILSSATISNLVGGTGADTITGGASADILTGGAGADTITGGAGADTLKGGIGADTLTGNTGADIFYYGKENITRNLEADADTITDFDVTTDKLNLIDVILYASGGITDSASLAKYIHAEADTSVATNVKLYIKTQGDIGGTVNDTNSNVLINFTVADATAQTELVNALSDNTLSEYILS